MRRVSCESQEQLAGMKVLLQELWGRTRGSDPLKCLMGHMLSSSVETLLSPIYRRKNGASETSLVAPVGSRSCTGTRASGQFPKPSAQSPPRGRGGLRGVQPSSMQSQAGPPGLRLSSRRAVTPPELMRPIRHPYPCLVK